MPGPRVAYLLLWFPEPSKTAGLDEVNTLVRPGRIVPKKGFPVLLTACRHWRL